MIELDTISRTERVDLFPPLIIVERSDNSVTENDAMDKVDICWECGAPLKRVALVDLVKTYEVDKEAGGIFIQLWHRDCYVSYHQRIYMKPDYQIFNLGHDNDRVFMVERAHSAIPNIAYHQLGREQLEQLRDAISAALRWYQ